MIKDILAYLLKLLAFTILLLGVHYYIFFIFFSEVVLFFPLWSIYLFNSVLVFVVFAFIRYKVANGYKKIYNLFLITTLLKMVLAMVFLLPLFVGKAVNAKIDVINFFIPYFFYLAFEIISLQKSFNQEETK